ncbi:MAG: CDP-glycerol glycerophosphotransferase family protein [Bacilli bacterium]|nr:CDP-glycerol glycerophosphotransferase family protein [Bacilli bacterium]
MKKIINNLKYIKLIDIFSFFIFILMVIPALIYKIYLKIINKKIWLICEDGHTARDNGYHLFKYIRVNHKEDNVYYVIDKKSNDYKKVKKYGNIINYASLKHWLYYMACDKNISSQKCGNPNPAVFYVVHIWFRLYNNRIFLQHGITKDDSKWLYYPNTKFKLFICGAKKEYDYVKNHFGYPSENIAYLGFPRFDNLYNNKVDAKQILIMPTWRNWLGRDTNSLVKNEEFIKTKYYKKWNSLLNNETLIKYVEKNNINIVFLPHINMRHYLKDFNSSSKNIKIADYTTDIQKLLKSSALLVTDYSSVYMDFAYMSKPIIYYQFDSTEYRKKQLQEGYFKYSKDAFGKVIKDEEDLVNRIIGYIKMDYKIETMYQNRIDKFFELKDQNNCRRIYEYLGKSYEK